MSNKKNLLQKIFDFQQEEIQLSKDKKAYGYNYAPLEIIVPLINPFLAKHRIGYYHKTEDKIINKNGLAENAPCLITVFYDVDNTEDTIICETIINEKVQLAKMNEFMVVGSAITYYKRYHITTVLGLISDEDHDAGGAKPSETNSNSKQSKNQSRRVESAASEDAVDYVKIFNNIVSTKPEKQALNMFKMYSKNMNEDVKKQVKKIINDKYKTK